MQYRWFWAYLLFAGGVACSFTYELVPTLVLVVSGLITAITNIHYRKSFLFLDVILLTICLWATGGAHNPLSILFLVPIAVSALTLSVSWTWGLCIVSTILYSLLYFEFRDFSIFTSHYYHISEVSPFSLHLWGMLVGFGLVSLFMAFFFTKLSKKLSKEQINVGILSEKTDSLKRLLSITSLAASTAHEINTPLSTIKLIASELPKSEDSELLKAEVARCEGAINRLRLALGDMQGSRFTDVSLSEVIERIRSRIAGGERIKLINDRKFYTQELPLEEALFALIKNGLEASNEDLLIKVGEDGAIELQDSGPGIPDEVLSQVGLPISSNKGLGLGIFLSKRFIEMLGGRLTFRREQGTVVRLEL